MAVAVEHVSSSGSSSGPRKWATISSFMAQHSDFVHHLAFDYHGHRLATCSADQRIKIWEFITPPQTAVGQGVKQSGSWSPLTTIKAAHGGPVNKVAWAHPQFGTILASCSADRYVKIFEEQIETGSSAHKWVNVAQWYCSPSSVTDLKFSPHSQGRLRLATCSVDGRVRVFEPSEEAKLTNWEEHKSSFQADDKDVLAVDWNPEYSPASSSAGNSDEKTEWTPAGMLAVASQHSVWIWEEQTAGDWTRAFEIRGHGDTVLDVAWAPHMGRSYHLIATACKDHRVRVFRLLIEYPERSSQDTQDAQSSKSTDETGGPADSNDKTAKPMCSYTVELLGEFDDHHDAVWRVEWSASADSLASVGDDGATRVWTVDEFGKWTHDVVETSVTAQPAVVAATDSVRHSHPTRPARAAAAVAAPVSSSRRSSAITGHTASLMTEMKW